MNHAPDEIDGVCTMCQNVYKTYQQVYFHAWTLVTLKPVVLEHVNSEQTDAINMDHSDEVGNAENLGSHQRNHFIPDSEAEPTTAVYMESDGGEGHGNSSGGHQV